MVRPSVRPFPSLPDGETTAAAMTRAAFGGGVSGVWCLLLLL